MKPQKPNKPTTATRKRGDPGGREQTKNDDDHPILFRLLRQPRM
jgi:hypothetical protein